MSTDTLTARVNAFVAAATEKHAGMYDYSEVLAEYVNAHTKITIGCPEHGQFMQEPNEHRRGQRCPDCSGRRNSSPSVRRDLFIARAREVHGDRYDYSRVRYVDQHTSVTIVCGLHGPFMQRPMNHLSSHSPSNCPACADDIRPVSLTAAWTSRPRPKRDRGSGEFRKAASPVLVRLASPTGSRTRGQEELFASKTERPGRRGGTATRSGASVWQARGKA